jgi:hypothetical protein
LAGVINQTTPFDAWWQNPNCEIEVNAKPGKVVFFGNQVLYFENVGNAAVKWESETHATLEIFIPYEYLPGVTIDSTVPIRFGSNSVVGSGNGWVLPVDQVSRKVTKTGII